MGEWPKLQKLYFEKQTLGIYLTGHPLEDFTKHIAWYTPYHSQNIKTAEDKSEIRLGGIVNHFKELRTKKNKKMAFVSLGDLKGDVEVIVFPELYEQKRILLQRTSLICLFRNSALKNPSTTQNSKIRLFIKVKKTKNTPILNLSTQIKK